MTTYAQTTCTLANAQPADVYDKARYDTAPRDHWHRTSQVGRSQRGDQPWGDHPAAGGLPFVVDVTAAGRRLLVRTMVVLAIVSTVLFLLLTSSVQAGNSMRATETHIVGQGDTLWGIAAERTAPGGDVRGTVADIRSMNRMDSSVLQVGTQLTVPAD